MSLRRKFVFRLTLVDGMAPPCLLGINSSASREVLCTSFGVSLIWEVHFDGFFY